MKIHVEHSDNDEGERSSVHEGVTHEAIEVREGCARGRIHVGRYCLDENHAEALEAAIHAARLELQARAVSL